MSHPAETRVLPEPSHLDLASAEAVLALSYAGRQV